MTVWIEKSISKEEHEKFVPYSRIVPYKRRKWKDHDITLEMFEHQWYFTEYNERNDRYEMKCEKTSCISLYVNEPRIPREELVKEFTFAAEYNDLNAGYEMEAAKRITIRDWYGGGCTMSWTVDEEDPLDVRCYGLRDFVDITYRLIKKYCQEDE